MTINTCIRKLIKSTDSWNLEQVQQNYSEYLSILNDIISKSHPSRSKNERTKQFIGKIKFKVCFNKKRKSA